MKSMGHSIATAFSLIAWTYAAADNHPEDVKTTVDAAVARVMEQYHIPGMAVGIVGNGQTYLFDYGGGFERDRETRRPRYSF